MIESGFKNMSFPQVQVSSNDGARNLMALLQYLVIGGSLENAFAI